MDIKEDIDDVNHNNDTDMLECECFNQRLLTRQQGHAITIARQRNVSVELDASLLLHNVLAVEDVFCSVVRHLNVYELDILQRVNRSLCKTIRVYKAYVNTRSSGLPNPFSTLQYGQPGYCAICVDFRKQEPFHTQWPKDQTDALSSTHSVSSSTTSSLSSSQETETAMSTMSMDPIALQIQALNKKTAKLIEESRAIDFANQLNYNEENNIDCARRVRNLSCTHDDDNDIHNDTSQKRKFEGKEEGGEDEEVAAHHEIVNAGYLENPQTIGTVCPKDRGLGVPELTITFSNQQIIQYRTFYFGFPDCVKGRASCYQFHDNLLDFSSGAFDRQRGLPMLVSNSKCKWMSPQYRFEGLHRDPIVYLRDEERIRFLHGLLMTNSGSSSSSSSSSINNNQSSSSSCHHGCNDFATSSVSRQNDMNDVTSASFCTMRSFRDNATSSSSFTMLPNTSSFYHSQARQHSSTEDLVNQEIHYPAYISKTQFIYACRGLLQRNGYDLPAVISMTNINEILDVTCAACHDWKLTLEFYNGSIPERTPSLLFPVKITKVHQFKCTCPPNVHHENQPKKQKTTDIKETDCHFILEWMAESLPLLEQLLHLSFSQADIDENGDLSGYHWNMKSLGIFRFKKTFSIHQIRELAQSEYFRCEKFLRLLSQSEHTSAELIGKMIVGHVTSACVPAFADDRTKTHLFNNSSEICFGVIPLSNHFFDEHTMQVTAWPFTVNRHHAVDPETIRSSNHDVMTFCIMPKTASTKNHCFEDHSGRLCTQPFIEWRIHDSNLRTSEEILSSPSYQHKSFRPEASEAPLYAYIYREVVYGNKEDPHNVNPCGIKVYDQLTNPYDDVEREREKYRRRGGF